jgi:hypothetical protein
VKLSCPGGYQYCRGTLTITTLKAIRPPKKKGKKRGKAKRLKLGSQSFTINYSKTGTVTIGLSNSALTKLRKLGYKSVRVRISVSDHDGLNNKATSSRRARLKLPRTHKKHNKHKTRKR